MYRPIEEQNQGLHADVGQGAAVFDQDPSAWLAGEFASLGRDFGYEHCLLARFPTGDGPEFAANLIATNWPEDLRSAYERAEVFAVSELVSTLRQTILPVSFVENPLLGSASIDVRQQLFSLFSAHGVVGHIGMLLRDRGQGQYLLLLSGRARAPGREDAAQLLLAAMELIQMHAQVLVPKVGPKERLSGREVECLRWSAAGKSSDEIAIILDISSHTVISYLKSAMRKLEAVNRMQAVARACRYNLL
ncbi:helix-turn-helix transcriptional regulator [Peteryoungia ipomoeae]|uniref:Helix-turn-helix transcriptional regulator n=1 Tax=Peteryoungia ipomoeae TaxID=1210932 RepID=A0A4S8NUY4_9HYPH|nr:helix-turn-helix transcriptional regulator [Peteryoungia ipomoeae]